MNYKPTLASCQEEMQKSEDFIEIRQNSGHKSRRGASDGHTAAPCAYHEKPPTAQELQWAVVLRHCQVEVRSDGGLVPGLGGTLDVAVLGNDHGGEGSAAAGRGEPEGGKAAAPQRGLGDHAA